MSRALAAALGKLLVEDDPLPASRFTGRQQQALDELAQRTAALVRVPSGAGSVYRVRQRELLQQHLSALRPIAAADLGTDLPLRAANIGAGRDSKRGRHGHAQIHLLAKAVGPAVVWRNGEQRLDLRAAATAGGAAALSLSRDDDWVTDTPLWLVENQAVFDRLDWFPDQGPATVAYYAGQLPTALLGWLTQQPRAPRVVLFADYDGVGLLNYARLQQAIPDGCHFWLMPGWRERLQRFGNRELWQRTLPQFQRAQQQLRHSEADPELLQLCQVMAEQGVALEHEAVWLLPNG